METNFCNVVPCVDPDLPAWYSSSSRDFRRLAQGIMGRAKFAKRASQKKLSLPLCLCAPTAKIPISAWVRGRTLISDDDLLVVIFSRDPPSESRNVLITLQISGKRRRIWKKELVEFVFTGRVCFHSYQGLPGDLVVYQYNRKKVP